MTRPRARRASPAARLGPAVLAAVVLLAAVLAGCGASATATGGPGLTPVPGAASGVAPTPTGPASPQTFQDAVDRLDSLTSWRYAITQTAQDGSGGSSRGVVVNAHPHRTRTDDLSGNDVAMSTIQIGSDSWMRVAGGAWQADPVDDGGLPIDQGGGEGDWSNPLDGVLWVVTEAPKAVVAELGVELHGGVLARHLRATVAPDPGAPVSDVTGMGFSGTVEAWIAADRGYLLGARASGSTSMQEYDDSGAPSGSPEVAPFRLEVTVDGVDDPANAVEAPSVAPPTPLPSGDPAVVALVRGMRAAQAALDRYELTVRTSADGSDTTLDVTVVNRPVPAVRIESTGDGDDLASLVIGEDAWMREGSGGWVPAARADLPFCTPPDPATGEGADCLEVLTSLLEPAEELAGTFTRVGEDAVDGVAAIHLRSDAGMGGGGMALPGTTDLWVAADGGWLVRYAFKGVGLEYDVRTARANDPSIRLDPPAR